MKCVHSVVLSKINACVSERKVVCTAVVNRLEKSVDFHAMIRETFWFHSSAGLGVVKSLLTRLYATHHSFSLPEPSSDQAKSTWSHT